jgi:hypothetical protein
MNDQVQGTQMGTKDTVSNPFLRRPGRDVDGAASHRFRIATLESI